ncbi:MAG: PKD domain-containing protein, partial [Bacteroidales bacterium]
KSMLSKLAFYSIQVNKYGILEFNSPEEVNAVLDILQEYSFKFNDIDTSKHYPNDPVLFAFESAYGFSSLRASIEEEVLLLEEQNKLNSDHDPDDHYIVSPYLRTLLTPTCEMIVNGLICKYFDNFGVGIMNFDYEALSALNKIAAASNVIESNILTFCSSNQNAFLLSETAPQLAADFSYVRDPKNPFKVYFINHSYSENYKDATYLWDFGDGSNSTEKNPTHLYSDASDLYDITLTIHLPQNTPSVISSHHIKKQVYIKGCQANFSYTKGSNGQCTFTSTSSVDGNITHYKWLIGDGSSEYTTTSPTFTHQFNHNATFHVRLTIYTDQYCSSAYMQQVQITNSNVCCKANAREVEKEILLFNGEKKVKSVIRVTNLWPFHRICSRVVHYKKKNGNNYVREKVNGMVTGVTGLIYRYNSGDDECGQVEDCTLFTPLKYNRSGITYDYGVGIPFRVSKESLQARFQLRYNSNGNWIIGDGPSIHQESCSQ